MSKGWKTPTEQNATTQIKPQGVAPNSDQIPDNKSNPSSKPIVVNVQSQSQDRMGRQWPQGIAGPNTLPINTLSKQFRQPPKLPDLVDKIATPSPILPQSPNLDFEFTLSGGNYLGNLCEPRSVIYRETSRTIQCNKHFQNGAQISSKTS